MFLLAEDGSLMLLQLPTSLSTIAAKMQITKGDANCSVAALAEVVSCSFFVYAIH